MFKLKEGVLEGIEIPLQYNGKKKDITLDKSSHYETFRRLITWIDKQESFEKGNRNNYVHKLSRACNSSGLDKSFIMDCCLAMFVEDDFDGIEVAAVIDSSYNYVEEHGTKSNQALDVTSVTPVTSVTDSKMLRVRTANQVIEEAKQQLIPKMLFSELWFEGDICILFSDTNTGKSTLAVQIGDSISKGQSIIGFSNESDKQLVLYFDFELSDKQFENRYSNQYEDQYIWDGNFIRVDINPDFVDYLEMENKLKKDIERIIKEKNAKILIVDNLTYLGTEFEKSKESGSLMKMLKMLKSTYGLSILCIAHTPKRDLTKGINKNDLQGSKMLMNFADSSFAIGESNKDSSIRYIKQIKTRNTEFIYGADNVIECELIKDKNFLKFNFLRYSHEWKHLKVLSNDEKEQLEFDIINFKNTNPTASQSEIAEALGTYKMKVYRVLKKAEE